MRSFILFLTVVSFISSALANPNLKPWHFLKPGKRDTVGGCDTDESNMQKAWTEVVAIIKGKSSSVTEAIASMLGKLSVQSATSASPDISCILIRNVACAWFSASSEQAAIS